MNANKGANKSANKSANKAEYGFFVLKKRAGFKGGDLLSEMNYLFDGILIKECCVGGSAFRPTLLGGLFLMKYSV